MINLTFKHLNDGEFNRSLLRLSKEQGFSNFNASYNVAKLVRKLGKELKTAQEMHSNIVKKYANMDEKGGFIRPEGGHLPYEIKAENQKPYNEELEQFMKTEVKVEVPPLTVEDLGTITLSPAEINALEPLLTLSSEQDA